MWVRFIVYWGPTPMEKYEEEQVKLTGEVEARPGVIDSMVEDFETSPGVSKVETERVRADLSG